MSVGLCEVCWFIGEERKCYRLVIASKLSCISCQSAGKYRRVFVHIARGAA